MHVIPMHQAKSNLSQLVKKAANGEEIYIGAYGKAQAKLVAVNKDEKQKKIIGLLKGKLHIPEDFDESLPDDILAGFEDR